MLLVTVITINNMVFCLTTNTAFLRNSIPHNNHDQASHLVRKTKDTDFLTDQLQLKAVKFHFQKTPRAMRSHTRTSRKQLKGGVVQRSVRLRKQDYVLFSSMGDFDICWAKKKGQQRGTCHPFIWIPAASRICCLKLRKFKFCGENYSRKGFRGLPHPYSTVHMRGGRWQQRATTLKSNLAFLRQVQGSLTLT